MINTPSDFSLPSPNATSSEEYMKVLDLRLRNIVAKIHRDFANGNATLSVLSSEPQLDDLDEGEMVLYSDSTDVWLYTRVEDSMYKTQLSEVT